jgi:transcriptional regulator with XRE-family HTH domain
MDVSELQLEFFRIIKTSVLDHLSITEEIAKVLNISVDSTYRRMRGEKILSLEELYALCSYYKISVDSVFNIQTGTIPFQSNSINRNELGYKEYIDELAKWFAYFNGFREKIFILLRGTFLFAIFFNFVKLEHSNIICG